LFFPKYSQGLRLPRAITDAILFVSKYPQGLRLPTTMTAHSLFPHLKRCEPRTPWDEGLSQAIGTYPKPYPVDLRVQ